jgi:hypothetical protein
VGRWGSNCHLALLSPAFSRCYAVPPTGLGFFTVTFAFPAEPRLLAGTLALIWVALIHVDESGLSFHCTVAPFSKFEPKRTKFSVEVPTGALEGNPRPHGSRALLEAASERFLRTSHGGHCQYGRKADVSTLR